MCLRHRSSQIPKKNVRRCLLGGVGTQLRQTQTSHFRSDFLDQGRRTSKVEAQGLLRRTSWGQVVRPRVVTSGGQGQLRDDGWGSRDATKDARTPYSRQAISSTFRRVKLEDRESATRRPGRTCNKSQMDVP